MCPHEKHNSHQELYSRNEHSEKACNYRKVITRLLSMPKMRKLLSKVSTVLRIGYCILIIYIPILRYGNCTKFPQMEYNIAYYKAVITSKKVRIPFLIKVFFKQHIGMLRMEREVVIFCTPKFLECINQFSKEKY